MRKNTIISGIGLLVIGLLIWIIGAIAYNNVAYVLIGFIMFIVGMIITIAGIILKEKNSIFPNPQPQMYYFCQPMQQQFRYCPDCGLNIPLDSKCCPYCSKSF
jgi:hypothetical protein